MSTQREAWATSALFRCRDCSWVDENHRTAVAAARSHSREYGHRVQGEIVQTVWYRPMKSPKVRKKEF